MPKRLPKGTFDKICAKENILLAIKNSKSRRGGRQSESKKAEIQAVMENLDLCVEYIQLILSHNLYTYFPYKIFYKKERGKIRKIASLPYFPYRIIDWAITQVCEHRFMNSMCDHSYAALKKRGTHKALRYLQKCIRSSKCPMVVKIDVKGYFEHINLEILEQCLKQLIKDTKVLQVLHNVIYGYTYGGIPLGNYLSQYFANIYLTAFDHYCKESLHIRYYIRYMDDIAFFGYEKRWLKRTFNKIVKYLSDIGLTVKQNWQMFWVRVRGVDMLGYKSYPTYTLLRTSTKKRFTRKLRKIYKQLQNGEEYDIHMQGCVVSYCGILSYCCSRHLYQLNIDPV